MILCSELRELLKGKDFVAWNSNWWLEKSLIADQDENNVLEELKALILAFQNSGWTDLRSRWCQSGHLPVLVRKLDWWPDCFFVQKWKYVTLKFKAEEQLQLNRRRKIVNDSILGSGCIKEIEMMYYLNFLRLHIWL